jgi:hypothetical protein
VRGEEWPRPAEAPWQASATGQPPDSGQVPGARTSQELIGRAAETAGIRRLLDGRRLVTVTGLPGVGKTAVSLAAAAAAAGNFADGALLVRLDTLRDEALLPHTIMAALQLPDRFTRSPQAAAGHRPSGRRANPGRGGTG